MKLPKLGCRMQGDVEMYIEHAPVTVLGDLYLKFLRACRRRSLEGSRYDVMQPQPQ